MTIMDSMNDSGLFVFFNLIYTLKRKVKPWSSTKEVQLKRTGLLFFSTSVKNVLSLLASH